LEEPSSNPTKTRIIHKKTMTKRTILSCSALFAWMLVIFAFSGEGHDTSSMRSGETMQAVYQVAHVMPSEFIVRKAAHTFLYIVLGVLAYNVVLKDRKAIWLSIAFCALYAVSDEIHQLFVPGRGPLATDVLIDTAASCVGIGIYWIIGKNVAVFAPPSVYKDTD
jgi:VanZ family protein